MVQSQGAEMGNVIDLGRARAERRRRHDPITHAIDTATELSIMGAALTVFWAVFWTGLAVEVLEQ